MSDVVEVRRGDVVVVRLDPAEGHETTETWPAVVVQKDVGNRNSSTTIVARAASTYRGYPFEVLVEAAESPFEMDSSVRLDQIRVVSIGRRIRSVVGRLDPVTMADVDEALKLSLGLDRSVRRTEVPSSRPPCPARRHSCPPPGFLPVRRTSIRGLPVEQRAA